MRTLYSCLCTLMLAGCGDLFDIGPSEQDTRQPDTREPDVDTGDVLPSLPFFAMTWQPRDVDPFIAMLLALPKQPNLLGQRLVLSADRSFDPCDFRVVHEGVTLELPCGQTSKVELPPLAESSTVDFFARDRQVRQPVAVPLLPLNATIHATVTLPMADGTTWIGTPGSGLFAVQPMPRWVAPPTVAHYPGVATDDPWDADAREPQSGFITDLARADDRALWVATATTGVSWFDPGADPFSRDDDVWVHGQPELAASLASDLAQTPIAIVPDPTTRDGLWVATVNGVYHALKIGDRVDFVRYADGPALSLSVAAGRVWVGMSTQVDFSDDDPEGAIPTAIGALLVIEPGLDTHAPGDAALRWSTFNEQAVTAVLADDEGAWVGTPYRMGRVDLATLALDYVSIPELDWLAVVDFAATETGFWVAARAECEQDGRLLHITVGDPLEVDDHTAAVDYRGFSSLAFGPSGDLYITMWSAAGGSALGSAAMLTARGCPSPRPTGEVYVLAPDGTVHPFLR